ncbi:hypothetical protein WJX72_011918 [[Myrmecia] bisecta]|uniref:Uncharacterized protein n=1 Tax=[Myrmecia] bisecta TaxID=41462 RepID=A0AAW1Q2C5_9CHLO
MPEQTPEQTAGPKLSNPLAELVGGGANGKYVKACTELYLGNRGIEKLQGFERLVNLEALWLDGNRLQSLHGLENNFRIRELHIQGNSISSLKPLRPLHHLETLGASNNQLRNLTKLIEQLRAFKTLKLLNLMGNPCTEEPSYRLQVIHALPSLHILDLHIVTPQERKAAAAVIGEHTAAQAIAFGQRKPAYTMLKVSERSPLEQDLAMLVNRVRAQKAAEAAAAEQRRYGQDPHPSVSTAGPLPHPPAWVTDASAAGSTAAADSLRSRSAVQQAPAEAAVRPPPSLPNQPLADEVICAEPKLSGSLAFALQHTNMHNSSRQHHFAAQSSA